jgi:ABC-type taurine transport system substrate-binding protein
MSDSEILNNLKNLISHKCIIAKKLNNVINYLHSLDIQKSELADDTYIKLINEEIDFYKKKLYDYSHLYVNIS